MNIIIVDDDKLVSLSLKTILEASGEVNVCAIGNCGEEALSLYPEFKPDILLMDIRMDGMSGLTAGKQILETYPDAKILFLTTFSDDEYIVRALRMGAKGYLLKQNFESILPALQAVQKGQTVFGEEITDKIPDLINKTTAQRDFAKYGITEKENHASPLAGPPGDRAILHWLAHGLWGGLLIPIWRLAGHPLPGGADGIPHPLSRAGDLEGLVG